MNEQEIENDTYRQEPYDVLGRVKTRFEKKTRDRNYSSRGQSEISGELEDQGFRCRGESKTKKVQVALKRKVRGVSDIPFLIVSLFAIFLFFIIFGIVVTSMNDSITSNGLLNSTVGLGTFSDNYVSFFDGLAVMVLVLLSIAVIFVGSQLNVNPAFFMFAVLLMIFLVIVAGYLSQAWGGFESSESMGSTFTQYPKISFIMNNLAVIIISMGSVGLILLYAKR